jgi:hypothetical protein
MSNHDRADHHNGRRAFLKCLGLGAGALGTGQALHAAPTAAADDEHDDRTTPARGYRETAHVREYYAKASF